jgi:hypothetical protein
VVLKHHRDIAILWREPIHHATFDLDNAGRNAVSSLAVMRSSVDLPQPEGRTDQNLPPAISRKRCESPLPAKALSNIDHVD